MVPAHKWLTLNLHNPYPSKEIKRRIASNTNSSIKDIDAWFIDVRKRIGWNKLRKTRFSNKQDEIIAAATRFFKPQLGYHESVDANPGFKMDENDKYRPDFLAMEHKVKTLYSGRFTQDPDLTPIVPQNDEQYVGKSSPSTEFAYPTPEPSSPEYLTEQSPLPTLPTPPLPEMPRSESRKRRRSSVDSSDDGHDDSCRQSSKRCRYEISFDYVGF